MARLTQNPNQFNQTAQLGQLTRDPQPETYPVRIQPNSTATNITVASALIGYGTSDNGEILVDVSTGPTSGPIVGVIEYSPQKNTYVAGDRCNMAGPGNVIFLESGAAITSWTQVSTTAGTSSADPLVATDVTSGHFITGVAITGATGAQQLVAVKIRPVSL